MPDTLLRTPLFHAHQDAGARIVPFAGWEMPLSYSGQLTEHQAVRSSVGIFDVSHMGQFRIQGASALAFLQHVVPGDMAALQSGQARYTQLCNENGGVIDDLIISRLLDDEFFAVVNAATRPGDFAWMQEQAQRLGYNHISLDDESDQWAMIAIQGPNAIDFLNQLIPGHKWETTAAFTMHPFLDNGATHYLSRTGYTGESGGELICPADRAGAWWKRALDAGAVPCGLAARDSLRLEAGYCLYGNDLTTETTPVEARLGWSIGWKKEENFIGREALEKQKAEKTGKRLIGVQTASRRPIRKGDKVTFQGEEVGELCSGGFSPGLDAGIGLAYITQEAIKAGAVEVITRNKPQAARIVKPPFVETSLSKD